MSQEQSLAQRGCTISAKHFIFLTGYLQFLWLTRMVPIVVSIMTGWHWNVMFTTIELQSVLADDFRLECVYECSFYVYTELQGGVQR